MIATTCPKCQHMVSVSGCTCDHCSCGETPYVKDKRGPICYADACGWPSTHSGELWTEWTNEDGTEHRTGTSQLSYCAQHQAAQLKNANGSRYLYYVEIPFSENPEAVPEEGWDD